MSIKQNILHSKKMLLLIGTSIILGCGLFFLGFMLGKKSLPPKTDSAQQEQNKEIRQSGYTLINPLLECEVSASSPIFKSTELEIKKIIQNKIIEKNPTASISLYYRDLKNGPSFGVNEYAAYSPASLLKVPLMIAYYKHAERDPGIFEKKITFEKASPSFSQQMKPKEHIELGKEYSISQLIESMIKHSDNEATNLLFQNMNKESLSLVFSDLGISMPDIYNANNSMSVKDYASFFRILYNASYLNRAMSEQALKLLSAVDFKNGLIAGVPTNILTAHKFGERESLSEDNQIVRQLHDCGIIYHPQRPYLICVMTKGENFKDLSKIVQEISAIVYEQVDKHSL